MPTRLDTNFPSLKDDDEFESLIRDICALEWGDSSTEKFGRKGQKQFGVDVYGRPVDLGGKYYATQCKLRTKKNRLTETEIECEVNEAKNFPHPLEMLILVTDSPRDTETQIIVDQINERQVANHSFKVAIWFWDAITERLASHPRLIVRYFRDYFANLTTLPTLERLIDTPLQLAVISIASFSEALFLEDFLKLRGIRCLPSEQINRVSTEYHLGDASPDGILCCLEVSASELADAKLVATTHTIRTLEGQLGSECPVFIVVAEGVEERLLHYYQQLGGEKKRLTLLPHHQTPVEHADYIFKKLFVYGYSRRGGLSTVDITIRSHESKPDAAFLDMYWQKWLNPSYFPSLEQWEDLFVPALQAVASQVIQIGDTKRIQITSALHLPAAFAVGFYFNLRVARVGVWARKRGVSDFKRQFWLSDNPISDTQYPENWVKPPAGKCQSAIVELATRDIHENVQSFASEINLTPDAWLQIRIDNQDSNIEEGHALAFAEQVARSVRHLNTRGVSDIHLFMQMPSALAVLIGQRLLACGRIHLYWFDNPTYRFAFTLR